MSERSIKPVTRLCDSAKREIESGGIPRHPGTVGISPLGMADEDRLEALTNKFLSRCQEVGEALKSPERFIVWDQMPLQEAGVSRGQPIINCHVLFSDVLFRH